MNVLPRGVLNVSGLQVREPSISLALSTVVVCSEGYPLEVAPTVKNSVPTLLPATKSSNVAPVPRQVAVSTLKNTVAGPGSSEPPPQASNVDVAATTSHRMILRSFIQVSLSLDEGSVNGVRVRGLRYLSVFRTVPTVKVLTWYLPGSSSSFIRVLRAMMIPMLTSCWMKMMSPGFTETKVSAQFSAFE